MFSLFLCLFSFALSFYTLYLQIIIFFYSNLLVSVNILSSFVNFSISYFSSPLILYCYDEEMIAYPQRGSSSTLLHR